MAGGFNTITLSDLDQASADLDFTTQVKTTGVTMQCPVRLGLKRDGSDLWTIPLEPQVSVRMSKTIVRRNIAKRKGSGTVKEAWNMDDYEISIAGLIQSAEDDKFPQSDLSKLKSYLTPLQSVVIHCKLLDVLGIGLISIEGAEFPHTPGVENQEYTFTGFSDQDFELVV